MSWVWGLWWPSGGLWSRTTQPASMGTMAGSAGRPRHPKSRSCSRGVATFSGRASSLKRRVSAGRRERPEQWGKSRCKAGKGKEKGVGENLWARRPKHNRTPTGSGPPSPAHARTNKLCCCAPPDLRGEFADGARTPICATANIIKNNPEKQRNTEEQGSNDSTHDARTHAHATSAPAAPTTQHGAMVRLPSAPVGTWVLYIPDYSSVLDSMSSVAKVSKWRPCQCFLCLQRATLATECPMYGCGVSGRGVRR